MSKTLSNTTESQAQNQVKDIKFWGLPDMWKLISKAHSEEEGWMKSTKAMEIAGVGCLVQVSTQQLSLNGGDSIAEAITFVTRTGIEEIWDENHEKVIGRKFVERPF